MVLSHFPGGFRKKEACRQVRRRLQDMKQVAEDLPVAACTVDVYLVASFIGILGNIINGAVKGCNKKNTVETPSFSCPCNKNI